MATRIASRRFPARTNTGGTGFAVALVIGSCMSLQFGAAFATRLFPHLGPSGVTTLRLFIAGLVLAIFTRPRVRRWSSQQWVAVILFGAAMGGMNGFFYEGIARIPMGPPSPSNSSARSASPPSYRGAPKTSPGSLWRSQA